MLIEATARAGYVDVVLIEVVSVEQEGSTTKVEVLFDDPDCEEGTLYVTRNAQGQLVAEF